MLNPRIDWNLGGKTVIVTGANTGIGKATALEMAKMGTRRLILACRNVAAGEAAAIEIRERAGGLAPDVVAVRQLDLASMASIRKFAHDINANEPDLHILINNAGYYAGDSVASNSCSVSASTSGCALTSNHFQAAPTNGRRKPLRHLSADGYELTFATNHLGSYLLTLLLLDLLKRSAPSRVVNVTANSFVFRLCDRSRGFLGNDPNFSLNPNSYTPLQAYCQSKLANVLFTRALHRLLRAKYQQEQDEAEHLSSPYQMPQSLIMAPASPPLSVTLSPSASRSSFATTTNPVSSNRQRHLADDKSSKSASDTPGNNSSGDLVSLNSNDQQTSTASSCIMVTTASGHQLPKRSSIATLSSAAKEQNKAPPMSKRQSIATMSTAQNGNINANKKQQPPTQQQQTVQKGSKRVSIATTPTIAATVASTTTAAFAAAAAAVAVAASTTATATASNNQVVASSNKPGDAPPTKKAIYRHANSEIVSVYAVSPGSFIETEMDRNIMPGAAKSFTRLMLKPFTKSAAEAAIMVVYCASQPQIENLSGRYFAKCQPVEPPPIACSDVFAEKLWQQSAKLVDIAAFSRNRKK